VAKGWIELPPDYARYDMAHALMPTQHMTRQQVWSYTGWAFASFYLDPVRLVRGVFSPNALKRASYRQMVSYIGTQLLMSLLPRI
jgi:anaerobic magnesium-protoporphyrin IX monomethyl ester cyclase